MQVFGGKAFQAEGTVGVKTLRQDCVSLGFRNSKATRIPSPYI